MPFIWFHSRTSYYNSIHETLNKLCIRVYYEITYRIQTYSFLGCLTYFHWLPRYLWTNEKPRWREDVLTSVHLLDVTTVSKRMKFCYLINTIHKSQICDWYTKPMYWFKWRKSVYLVYLMCRIRDDTF